MSQIQMDNIVSNIKGQKIILQILLKLITNRKDMIIVLLIMIMIGVFSILKPVAKIAYSLYHHFRKLDLKQKYGEGWAIVTGATDGIGFGFCQALAAQGFNICLISRNSDKLAAKIDELKSQFGEKIRYVSIKADFKQSHQQGFFDTIVKELERIKPVILVNNVGIADITMIKDQQISEMRDIISVNCLPMSFLSSYFIQRCSRQNYKGGIVNLSSYSWVNPMPYMSVYAGTKAYNDAFSISCSRQNKNIDVLSVRAMMVISGGVKRQKSIIVPTSRECAEDSLKYLGYCEHTAGHIKHEIVSHLTDVIPSFLFKLIAFKQAHKVYLQYKDKKQ